MSKIYTGKSKLFVENKIQTVFVSTQLIALMFYMIPEIILWIFLDESLFSILPENLLYTYMFIVGTTIVLTFLYSCYKEYILHYKEAGIPKSCDIDIILNEQNIVIHYTNIEDFEEDKIMALIPLKSIIKISADNRNKNFASLRITCEDKVIKKSYPKPEKLTNEIYVYTEKEVANNIVNTFKKAVEKTQDRQWTRVNPKGEEIKITMDNKHYNCNI